MKRTLFALFLITSLLTALACERRGNATNGSGTGPIVVGYYGDLSGRTSSFGQSTKNGAEMAADEINKAGGINGRMIQIIVEDDQGEPNKAATVVTKLINQDKVMAILGEVASSNSLAAAPKAQEAKVPMISPSSTNPAVTQVGDYIFRVCFIDPFQGEVMAKFAANNLKAKRAAILYDFNSDYSRGLYAFFKRSFTGLGGQIVSEKSYTQGDRDFSGQLTAIRSANPDVIYVPGYYGEVGVISNQTKQLGIKAPLLGGDGWDAPQLWQLGGASLNGNYISNHYSVDDPSPAIQKFVADYKARYNISPDALAALGYDSMKVLADAIKRAGSTENTKLRDAIAQTKDFPGVTGKISIDKDRNAVKPAVVLKLENSKFVYETTIAPEGSTPPATSTSPASGTATAGAPAPPAKAASPAN
ncbi:MAG TPA: ABC transporter substrate-binding protein [Pyrinomonadaceae bacterium]|jgi:branched-chain amino acid transport system substrate-binding protein|nr:ABC transporter substrate-binding protein [Pyrinomonadaceae bacterium]